MLNSVSKDCFNLPDIWKNRVSSIFTNKCIVLYTQEDCKDDAFKATLKKNKVYLDEDYLQYRIASKNFYGSW